MNDTKTKRQTRAARWKTADALSYPELAAMNALILYDDFHCAANINALLHYAAQREHITVRWDVQPWRLDMLEFPPMAERALDDAANAHLIVLAARYASSFPGWLMRWLDQWAELRVSADTALAVMRHEDGKLSLVSAAVDLIQFARRHRLKLICDTSREKDDKQTFLDNGSNESSPSVVLTQTRFATVQRQASYPAWGLND
jgi:hypothetical protein